jgi:uncharacterized protein YggE
MVIMFKKSILFVALASLLLAACGTATPTVVSGGSAAPTTGVSVTGHGEVRLAPDIAYVTIGVHTTGSNVSDVVAANAEQVASVMASLADLGVAPEDMQTSNFNVYASDSYDPATGLPSGTTYTVDNQVNVTARDLANLGSLLDRAVSSGANSIWGVSFDVADKDASQAEARDEAVQDAVAEAQALAAAAGIELGSVISINYAPTGYYYGPYYGMGGGGGAAEAASTSIVPGQITVSADVTITYAIQ